MQIFNLGCSLSGLDVARGHAQDNRDARQARVPFRRLARMQDTCKGLTRHRDGRLLSVDKARPASIYFQTDALPRVITEGNQNVCPLQPNRDVPI